MDSWWNKVPKPMQISTKIAVRFWTAILSFCHLNNRCCSIGFLIWRYLLIPGWYMIVQLRNEIWFVSTTEVTRQNQVYWLWLLSVYSIPATMAIHYKTPSGWLTVAGDLDLSPSVKAVSLPGFTTRASFSISGSMSRSSENIESEWQFAVCFLKVLLNWGMRLKLSFTDKKHIFRGLSFFFMGTPVFQSIHTMPVLSEHSQSGAQRTSVIHYTTVVKNHILDWMSYCMNRYVHVLTLHAFNIFI